MVRIHTVKVSPKFQVVIPKDIRENLNIKPGKKLVVIEKEGVIHLIPVGNIRSLRGFARDVTTEGLRDESERFD